MSNTLFSRVPYRPPNWLTSNINNAIIPSHKLELGRFPTPTHAWKGIDDCFENTLNLDFLVKRDDLSSFDLGGNKVRKLQFLLAEALEQEADSVITIGGIQSNHARATAVAARQLGLDPYLILRTSKGDNLDELPTSFCGNLLFDRMVGSHIYTVTASTYAQVGSDTLVAQLTEQLKAQGKKPYPIPVGGSNSVGVFGYLDAIAEMKDQNIEFDHLVFACGSGGTAAGLSIGAKLSGITNIHAIGVCDSPDYFYDHIQDTANEIGIDMDKFGESRDWLHIYHGAGLGYARNTEQELEFLMKLSQNTGVILDPVYSGKGLYHFLHEVLPANINGHFKEGEKVLFLHTGGVLGLYDKAAQMAPVLQSMDAGSFNKMSVTMPPPPTPPT